MISSVLTSDHYSQHAKYYSDRRFHLKAVMIIPKVTKYLILIITGLIVLPSLTPVSTTTNSGPTMTSYNPGPAARFHAPLSSASIIAVAAAQLNVRTASSSPSQSTNPSNLQTIHQNALRFINDSSYFPQSETSVAVDPNNSNHVVGGFNDGKFFFCPFFPAECGTTIPVSLSGFTVSNDGGMSVAKGGSLPNLNASGVLLTPWGDPSLAPTIDGNFFYASLAISSFDSLFGNGVMIAKSNANLFNPNVSCATPIYDPTNNPCWDTAFVNGETAFPVYSLEDKERIAVDRDPSSPYYGSVYVGWDHFSRFGFSSSFLARCDGNLAACTMLSEGPVTISGGDLFVAWTTPVVDKSGNVYVAWCNFGTFFTFGPVNCRVSSSPPGGTSFGPPSNILSYMGSGTTLPADTVVIGWATEQFRTGLGLISISTDPSPKSNNLYFTTSICTAGHYYAVSAQIVPVAADNPGNCGQSAIIFSESANNGTSWSAPIILSNPAVNDQPYVTVDSQTGTVYVVYYTTQYDPFNHRINVVGSMSNNLARTFHQQRVTTASDEPNADPNMYDYILSNGFGGSFTVPQFGDYFEATARAGILWILFTGNYAVEAGTFQTDPFLAVLNGQ